MKHSLQIKAVFAAGLLLVAFSVPEVCGQTELGAGTSGGATSGGGTTVGTSPGGGTTVGTSPGGGSNAGTNPGGGTQGGVLFGGGTTGGIIPKPRFRASVDLQEGYNTNVFTANSDKLSSEFTTATVNLFADLGSGRTVFTIGLSGGLTYYASRTGHKPDKLGNFSLNLVHKLNDRITLTLNSLSTYQVQPQFDLLVPQNRVNGQYLYTSETANLSYQWTRRFSTVTGYTLTGIFYQEAMIKNQDYVQQTFSNQFRYLALPTTTLVAEYRFGLIDYLYNSPANTITNYALAGFDHSFSPKASMTLRAGGQIQDQKSGSSSFSPYAELTANYQYQRYSTLQAYLNYGFQYSGVAAAQNDTALRIGMTVNHGLTPKLSAFLAVFYEHDDFSQIANLPGTAYTEDSLNVNTGIRFAITQKLSLQAGFQHTTLLSSVAINQFDQNIYSIGATYSF